ncbi:tetratricopeptide repeat protein [Roseomonas sp. CCTCC AB2023176]|uniref:tetratricopeptide repeat protein n=1 Tax=Roseomonas sp. CCTCC AB2023176 TaxID=3342640 RepID=UPI0035DE7662
MAGLLLGVAGGAAAQSFDPPLPGSVSSTGTAARTTSRAGGILLDQANYWSAQGRPNMALSALERLIALEPNNAEVLSVAAEVAIQNGDRAAAESYLARVAQIAPGSPAQARAQAALRSSSVDQLALGEARRLAQAGQREAAMQRYREIFPNTEVPDAYAAEYYQTLASVSSENFRDAVNALREAVRRQPENRALQLAYAQLLTYREVTRSEGVERLAALSQIADIASGARAAWRQALLWQGPSGESEEQINVYLARYPDDQEIIAKLAEIRAVTADPVAEARIRGFELLRDNKIAEAEALFNNVLTLDANEPTGLLGLAMVRRRQSKEVEARELLERATAVAPDRRAEFLESLGYNEEDLRLGRGLPGRNVPGGAMAGRGGGRGGGNVNYTPPSVPARRALAANRLDEAARLAQRAAGERDEGQKIEASVILGRVALQRRDYVTAEVRFREALNRRRSLPEAQQGLYAALAGQRKFAEADAFASANGFRPNEGTNLARAAALRQEAVRENDADVQISLLRGAVAAAPEDVWSRHDLARVLKARGQREEALRIERELLNRRTVDGMFAAALLANQDGRAADTVARLEAIPARAMTADGRRLLELNRRIVEVQRLGRLARGNPTGDAARQLVAIAAQPDPTGEIPASVVRTFGALRQGGNAEAAARAAGAGNPDASPRARAILAAALLDAGERDDARRTVAEVDRDPRLGLDGVRGPVVRTASTGSANALQQENPLDNRRPQLSIARVYANSGRTEEGLLIAENVLAQNPANVEARSVAGEAAVLNGSFSRAEELLREGRAIGADELQMALLEARIARARRDTFRARRALEEAARLRGEQLRAGG